MTEKWDRRSFFKLSSVVLGAVPLLGAKRANSEVVDRVQEAGPAYGGTTSKSGTAALDTRLHWLEGAPRCFSGVTWGVPWPQGTVAPGMDFALRVDKPTVAAGDAGVDVQSWPLAYWPDGSIKWSAHAVGPEAVARPDAQYRLDPRAAGATSLTNNATVPQSAMLTEEADGIRIDTGAVRCVVPRRGDVLFRSLTIANQASNRAADQGTAHAQGQAEVRDATLVVLTDEAETQGLDAEAGISMRTRYRSRIDAVLIEQRGPIRAVLKLTGTHIDDQGRTLIPFVIRMYWYRGSDSVRLVHSLIYDADPVQTVIRGVGLRFSVPMTGELHDRYIRFVGANGGVFAEAVRGLTGLRRDPGAHITQAQLDGRATPPLSAFPADVARDLRFVPAFGNYTLLQSGPNDFSIAKRTAPGCGWIRSASGERASGTGYLGSVLGGMGFGVRNFWQSYPGQIDIADAQTSQATLTLWLWAPDAPGMDLRAYHDGMGEDSYTLQRDALDITYEDYEPGFNTPYGVARTSEVVLQLFAKTPSHDALVDLSQRIQSPPQWVVSGERMHQAGVFSDYWRPAQQHPTPQAVKLDKQLAWSFDYYHGQVEQRSWYGFWDYGDVMHTYDPQRHVWRYDVGGFAWDNGELSTEIWLWHYYLHSGRADVFRMAEAMTRHCSEVDVHHIGRFSPLGSRHDVQHWGDSAKQLRVSTVANHRFYYYLTADERIGDLMRDQVNAVDRLRQILPGRKIGQAFPTLDPEHHASVSFGTDWGAVAAAWLTEWERTGLPHYRNKLVASMESIAAQPHGFFTGIGVMDLRTGRFVRDTTGVMSVSHLSAVFGLPEVCSELLRTLPVPAFRDAWLQYCTLYSASAAEQQAALGKPLGKLNLSQGHARLLAFAGVLSGRADLQRQAWAQFDAGRAGITYADQVSRPVHPPTVLDEIDEAPSISTNAVAQWGLGAIGLLALSADLQPESPA